MVIVVKVIIVIFRKIKTFLILTSFKLYFSHPEKINTSGILVPGLDLQVLALAFVAVQCKTKMYVGQSVLLCAIKDNG